MARLPTPGADENAWGDVLNDYLNVAHNADGSLKPIATAAPDGSITTVQIADNAVTDAKLDVLTQATLATVASKYTKPANGVPATDLETNIQTSLAKADSALQTVPVTSVNTQTGAVSLTKADIGLASIDNTSDTNKPISSATQSVLDTKVATTDLALVATSGNYNDLTNQPAGGITAHSALSGLTNDDHSHYHTDARGDIRYYTKGQVDTALTSHTTNTANPHAVTKNQVGLGNVPDLDTTNAVASSHIHSNNAILDASTASFTISDKTKLDTISAGAEVNDTHTLDDITDVVITVPTSGQIIKYNGSNWVNDTDASGITDHSQLTGIGTTTHAEIDTALAANASHITNTANPHTVTKAQVGLTNVDNTNDASKPVSTAQAAADTAAKTRANHTGTQLAGTISDFTSTVTSNTDVTANTIARHSHTNSSVLNATTASFTTADETKLDGITAGATNYVHPTSDGSLHVPATSTVNDGKVLRAGATAGSLSWGDLIATDVGLGNVNNTADSAKPVSTAQAAADTAAKARFNHTGTQLASTISDFVATTDALITTDKTATGILAGTDLDTIIIPGKYHQNSNAAATLILNYPAVFAGLLEVESPSSSFIYQRYTAYKGGLDRVYVRGYYNALWSAWTETAKVGVNDGRFAGEVATSAAVAVPTGWLACDGTAISRTTYASLFTAISTTYGVGDGSTTFNVPNYKGRALVGVDSAQPEFNILGETGGAKTHTLLTSEMPSHNHIQDAHNHTQSVHNHTQNAHSHLYDSNAGNAQFTVAGGTGMDVKVTNYSTTSATAAVNIATTAVNIATTATNQAAGGSGAHNNLQPYMTVSYIIHY